LVADDTVLLISQKSAWIVAYATMLAEQSGIDAQATLYGITTEKTAYDAAISALTAYLDGLTIPVAWNDLSDKTTIVGATFRANFQAVETTRQTLLIAFPDAAAAAVAYTLPIATASVLGGVKPDGATITNTSGAISVTYPLTSAPGSAAYTFSSAYDAAGAAATKVASVSGTAPIVSSGSTTPTISITDFVASGASHARGAVPDPGASAGSTKFLREDATFAVPSGTSTVYREPLTNGDLAAPELIFAGGDVIMA
jgi:hypothetical protein